MTPNNTTPHHESGHTALGSPATVTVLGLGSMGRAIAGAFLAAGHAVTVWNRTPGRGDELVARGAVRAETSADAVRASGLVVACFLDQSISREVLDPLAVDLRGRDLVDLSSDTPQRAREAAAWADAAGVAYLDGAILSNVPMIGSAAAQVIYSGSRPVFDRHRATLRALAGGTTYLGEEHSRAAAHDVAMLDYFWTAMSGVVHAFALARAEGIDAAEMVPLLSANGDLLGALLSDMASAADRGEYPGDADNIVMDAAGVDHVLRAAEAHGLDVSVLRGVKSVADRAIATGRGGESWIATIKAVRSPAIADGDAGANGTEWLGPMSGLTADPLTGRLP